MDGLARGARIRPMLSRTDGHEDSSARFARGGTLIWRFFGVRLTTRTGAPRGHPPGLLPDTSTGYSPVSSRMQIGRPLIVNTTGLSAWLGALNHRNWLIRGAA